MTSGSPERRAVAAAAPLRGWPTASRERSARPATRRSPAPWPGRTGRSSCGWSCRVPTRGLAYGSKEQTADAADIERGAKALEKRDRGAQSENVGPTPLAVIPDSEKIYLHGHGSAGQLGNYSAAELADAVKDMGLRKDSKGVIVLAACESGVRTRLGIGPSLAGELAGILKGQGYQAKVEGMTGRMLMPDEGTGEIRILTDPAGYEKALAEFNVKKDAFTVREKAFGEKAPGHPSGAEIDAVHAALERELNDIRNKYSVPYELGGRVLRGDSDSRAMLAGAITVGLPGAAMGALSYYADRSSVERGAPARR